LTTRGAPSLQTNPRYTNLRAGLASDGIVLFADIEGARTFGEGLATPQQKTDYELKVRPFLTPFRALGGSFRTEAAGDVHGVLRLIIQK
jgi:hypothetical protein